jgi:hypothetical protein
MQHNETPDDADIEDLYTAYCDLYTVAGEWLTAGAALNLDDLLASVTVLERLDTIIDMDKIERYGPLVTGEPTVRSVIDNVRDLLRDYFSQQHLSEPKLRQLRDGLRSLTSDLQKAIGGLESRTADIVDLKERIAMRKQIHAISGLQKRIRSFANMLSSLHELRWTTTFSVTRVQVTPKSGTICQPLQSTILQLEIPQAVSIEAVIEGKRLTITIDGSIRLSAAGRPDITDVEVSRIVIDKTQGVILTGSDREIALIKKGSRTNIQVEKIS